MRSCAVRVPLRSVASSSATSISSVLLPLHRARSICSSRMALVPCLAGYTDSFTDGTALACGPLGFEPQAWFGGGMDQPMLVDPTLTNHRITHHERFVIGVIVNSHTEVLVN